MHFSRRLLIVPMMLGVILSFAAAGFGTPSASAQVPSYGNLQNCVPIGSITSCIVTVNASGPVQASLTTGGTWGNGCIGTSSSITVTCSVDSTGTMITISCGGGCPASTTVQVIVNGATSAPAVTFALAGGSTSTYSTSSYTTPTYTSTAPVGSITVGQQQPSLQVTVSNSQPAYSSGYSTGGQCVGGSYPTVYGCTSGYAPYYQPISYLANSGYNNGCVSITFSCTSYNNGCVSITFNCTGYNNGCFGIWGGCAGGCSGSTWGCFNNNNCFSWSCNNNCSCNNNWWNGNHNWNNGNNWWNGNHNWNNGNNGNNGCGNNSCGFGNFGNDHHGDDNHGCVTPHVWSGNSHSCN